MSVDNLFFRPINAVKQRSWMVGQVVTNCEDDFYPSIDACFDTNYSISENKFIACVATDPNHMQPSRSTVKLTRFKIVEVIPISTWLMQFTNEVVISKNPAFIQHIPAERQGKLTWKAAFDSHDSGWISNPEGVKWLQQCTRHTELLAIEARITRLQSELKDAELERAMLKAVIDPHFTF